MASEYLPVKCPRFNGSLAEQKLAQALRTYTNPNKNSYDPEFDAEIRALQPGWFSDVDIVVENKSKIIKLAKSGARRPVKYTNRPSEEQRLGVALSCYIYKKTNMYDPVFERMIRKLRPDWFIKQSEKNKSALIKLARSGASKPKYLRVKNDLGSALRRYTNPDDDGSYDPKFDKLIRSLRQDWFVNAVIENKQELLRLAKDGADRPIRSVGCSVREKELASRLWSYTAKSQKAYDQDFDRYIRKVRPDWFLNQVEENKKQLIERAKSGASKPRQTPEEQRLYSALANYTHNGSGHDKTFIRLIRSLRPDWFANTATITKKELILLAKSGAERPVAHTQLGDKLRKYTHKRRSGAKNGYDQDFDKTIRKLCPDWFVVAKDEFKKQLIKLAKSGAAKPIHNTAGKRLAGALARYTKQGKSEYDHDFDGQIRKLRPDWFLDTVDNNKRQLLQLAKNGADRPRWKDNKELYTALANYTLDKNTDFSKQIRALRPDWFIDRIAEHRKKCKHQLITLARRGSKRPRPTSKNPEERSLCVALTTYTRRTHASYDKDFTELIRALRRDWFR
ncbi:MAG: hypothetical protein WC919_03980 [Candidatus Paceibacterota bacterium]